MFFLGVFTPVSTRKFQSYFLDSGMPFCLNVPFNGVANESKNLSGSNERSNLSNGTISDISVFENLN